MKHYIFILFLLLYSNGTFAQKTTAAEAASVPCNGNADGLPGTYTDHTNPKYPGSLKGNPQDKAAMTRQLIALEKLEEASRREFQLTGCVARVSFSGGDKNTFGNNEYGYQLAAYRNVCHVTEHIVKTVGEYLTVLRINVNPTLTPMSLIPCGTGEFYIDKSRSVRYDIPIDAKQGPNYSKDRLNNPSRISQYTSRDRVLTSRSSDYKNKQADFLKIINGEGYVENWMSGSQYDKPNPRGYKLIDRHYLITRPGIPLLIPVSRKQFLEDLLEYFEIEKANFYYNLEEQMKNSVGNNSDNAKKRTAVFETDKAAYPALYEAKKSKVKQLLTSQKAEWLQKPAIVDYSNNIHDASQWLADTGKFYDEEDEKKIALYIFNPAYFKTDIHQPSKPILMEVAFRYEIGEDRGFSIRLFDNFVKNYDMDALRKMLQ